MLMLGPGGDLRALLAFLPANYRELAHEHKQLETKYGGARITQADDLLRLIFLHVGADMPLRQTVALVKESGAVSISPNSLHMRMRRAAPYLQALVTRMTTWSAECEPERWGGYDLVACDGTSFSGRASAGTDARIHVALRMSNLSIVEARATSASVGESFKCFDWLPGQLVLADRGYSTGIGILHVKDQGADVLVRLNQSSLPLFRRDDERFDVFAFLRSLSDGQIAERNVRARVSVGGRLRTVEGRLVATRLPAEKAEEARARVNAEHRGKASAESLEMAAYVALFTTAPSGQLSAAQCIEVYRLRWQIELLFKRWKSLCHFDRLPNERNDTIVSWLYGKVLLGLILDRIATAVPPLSPPEQLAS
jgi:Transposase DDE domain